MKKLLLLYFSCCMFLLSSCNEWLNVNPKTQSAVEKLLETEKGFEDAINGCYIKMKNTSLYGKNMTMAYPEYLAQMFELDELNQREEIAMSNFDYTHNYVENAMSGLYSSMYNLIAETNVILEYIDVNRNVFIDTNKCNIIKAEALAIRAFCHFDVLRLFGQLPQNATIEVSLPYAEEFTKEMIPYYDYKAFVQKLYNDIEVAERLLYVSDPCRTDRKYMYEAEGKDSFYYYRKFKFNYWAVTALKARMYLYFGENIKAASLSKEIIKELSENDIMQLAGKDDLNSGYCALPSECIFGLSNHKLVDYANTLFETSNTIQSISKSRLSELFEGRDITVNNRYRNLWGTVTTATGVEKPFLRKYVQPDYNISSTTSMLQHQVIPLLRLSELYLIAMETSESLDEINDLYIEYMLAREEQVSGFESLEAAEKEIENEYRREFIAEGVVFFMYKRKNAETMKWKESATITERNYIVPLPKTELKN